MSWRYNRKLSGFDAEEPTKPSGGVPVVSRRLIGMAALLGALNAILGLLMLSGTILAVVWVYSHVLVPTFGLPPIQVLP